MAHGKKKPSTNINNISLKTDVLDHPPVLRAFGKCMTICGDAAARVAETLRTLGLDLIDEADDRDKMKATDGGQ